MHSPGNHPQDGELWCTVTSERPPRLLGDDGVRRELAPDALEGLEPGPDALRAGQRLLARTNGGHVVALRMGSTPLVVHPPLSD